MEGYDCAGHCFVDIDCLGECGGDAIVDDCGVCDGGNADLECAGDCGGDADYDCAGVCNGNSVEDICGDCNGTATDPAECVQEGFMLSFGAVDMVNGTLEVVMNNEDVVAGFQFNISGSDRLSVSVLEAITGLVGVERCIRDSYSSDAEQGSG